MAINLDVHGNTQPLEAAVQAAVNRIRRTPIKITVDDKGATQPLGNMKRGADEFTKSMEAANARIIAFGASMAIINGVADSFKAMVRNMVEVEKSLADINVVMGLNAQSLEKFSDGLFKVAKETGAAFKIAADAATEYARQGLNVEESLKRTKDALILTRLTGMDSAEAVKSLTAAMNTYGHQIKDTTQLVSKFAAVDVKFAVSAEDFADAISRTGAAAKGAGVDIDELIGLVTAAQQQTARGGKVIGNSFKTIFTRIGRTDTLNQLENLGIAVRDIEGRTLGAKRILSDLANTFDTLSEAQKAQIAQTVGGVFQINVLKAVLGDAAKQNGILANATQISANATDEAITKNEQLRNTMAAMATETGLAIKQVSAQAGEIALGPGIEKVLNTVKAIAENISGSLGDGEGAGNEFAKGLLRGIGNVITGPGLVVLTTVFIKLFGQAFKFTKDSLGSLIGITNEAQKQKAIQTSIVTLFGQNAALSKEMLRTDISRTEKEKIILSLLKAQVAEANVLNNVSKQAAATLYTKGYGANLTPRKGRAYGHIPNFAHPEREQAAKGGYSAGNIREMNMPGEGPIIYNSSETVKNFKGMNQPAIMPPQSSKAGKNYQQAFGDIHGFDPYAAGGYIPNFAKKTAAEYLENARNAKTTANLTNIVKGRQIGGVTFSPEQQAAAAAALRERSAAIKTVSTSSQLKAKDNDVISQIYNKSGKMVLFAASAQGGGSYAGDRKKNIIYLNPNPTKGGSKFSTTNKTGMVPVNVPYFTIGKNDEERAKNDPKIKNKIEGDLVNQAQKTTNHLVSTIFKEESIPNVIKPGDVAVTVGNVFEKILMSVQKGVAKEAYDADPPGNALLDIPRGGRDALWNLFGATPLGSLGAEAKIALGSDGDAAHLKSAAEKFYKIDSYKGPGGKKAKAFAPAGQAQVKRGGTKASGHIPNFAKVKWSIDKKKGQYGLTGSHMELMQFVDYLERAGVEPKKLEVLKTRIKKIQSNIGKKRTEFKQNNVPGFGRSGARYYDQLKAISQGSYLDTKGTFIKDLGKYVKDFNRGGGMFAAGLNAGKGFIPNFAADPLTDAIGRERDAGIPVSQIRVGTHPALMNKGNPIGLGVTNTKDEPNGLRDVFGSANGFVPNYASEDYFKTKDIDDSSLNRKARNELMLKVNKELKKELSQLPKGRRAAENVASIMEKLTGKYKLNEQAVTRVSQSLSSSKGYIDKLNVRRQQLSSAYQKSMLGKVSSSAGKMFGGGVGMTAMIGAPMAAGFLQSEGAGQTGAGSAMYAAGGALQGAASGGMMASMIAPFFGPAAPLVIGVGGLMGAVSGMMSASEANTEALKENARQENIRIRNMATTSSSVLAENIDPNLKLSETEMTGTYFKQNQEKLGDIGILEALKTFGLGDLTNVSKDNSYAKKLEESMARIEKFTGESPVSARRSGGLGKFQRDLLIQGMKGREKEVITDSSIIESFGFEGKDEVLGEDLIKKIKSTQGGTGSEGEKRINAMMFGLVKILNERVKSQKKIANGLILQLNLQKAMIHAQQKSAEAQLDIKAEYIDMSNSLKTEKQLMGSLISEERKARIDFIGAINKAEEAYELGTNQAKSEFKKGLISDVSSGQNAGLTQALKQKLFKDLNEAALEDKTTVDLTNELNSKSAEDLLQILKDIGVNEDQANKIVENRSLLYQNQITLLGKQKTISDSQANSELTINNILGKRRELLEDMNQSIQNFNRNSSFLSESSALDKRIADAGRSVGGYTSKQKQLQIDRSDLESRIVPGMVRKSSGAKLGILQQASKDLEIGGFTDEEIDKILKMEGKEVDISSILESRFKDAGGKNEITNLQDVLGGYGKDLLSDEEFQQTVGGGETRQEMKQRLEELKILDQQRLGVNEDLNKEIKNINDSLIQQNILKEKGVQAVESELSAREKNDRYMRGQSVTIDGQVDDRSAITRGMSNSFAEMRDQAQYMHYEIGKRVPNLLADGLAEAMQVALNGADDLGDAMTQIGINFLQSIQSAFLQQAAQGIVGMMGFNATNRYNGGPIRNYSKGGSVPAMVSDGEYLMSKEAVNRYGGSFMHTLNSGGKIPKYANGGWVDSGLSGAFASTPSTSSPLSPPSTSFDNFFAPQPEFSVLPPKSFKQKMMGFINDDDNMKLFEQEYQKAQAEAFAPSTALADVFSNPPASPIFTEPPSEFSVLPPRSFKNKMMDFLGDSDNMKLFEDQYGLAQKKAAGIEAFSLKNQPSPQQKMEKATSPFNWKQNSDGTVDFGSTPFETPLRRSTTVSDIDGTGNTKKGNWDPFALIDPNKIQGPPAVDQSADILKLVEKQLVKERSQEVRQKGANISQIRKKYDYLLNSLRNKDENVFDYGKTQDETFSDLIYSTENGKFRGWDTSAYGPTPKKKVRYTNSLDKWLRGYIHEKRNPPFNKRGFSKGGRVQNFAEGGDVEKLIPEEGSALAENFGGGRAFESGRAYQSKAMSGYFYSGLAGNVGIEDDASKLREVLAEEERQRQKALMKKRKKKQFWQSLAGTALSAGIAWGTKNLGDMFQKPDATLDLSREAILNAPSESFNTGLGDSFGSFDNISSLSSSSLANQYDYFGRPKIGRNSGGFIRKYAGGGYISGKSGIDQIPAMLSEGEYVIKASSARKLGKSTLDSINAGKFNDGGPVSGEFGSSDSNISGGNTNNINISINMERGKASSESEQKSGQNPAEQSEEQSSNVALADKIKQQVVSVIVEEQRPGGLLSG